jgi:diguanylate cyclase (GGDEF)-like protein/PAS domain S-box-containing protein
MADEAALHIAAVAFETHDAIMISDTDGNIIRVNRAFEKITGYSQEEVLGKNPRILSSRRHDANFYTAMWQELLTTGVWSGEVWDKHKNGTIYPTYMTTTAVINSNNEITHYVCIFSDISGRKKAEAALSKTEHHLYTILNTLEEIVWTASAPNFDLHLVSAATEKVYGIPQQAFLDDPELWFKTIHPDDKLRVQASTAQIFQLGKTEIEYRIIRADGQERWLSDRMYVVYDEDGTPSELSGVVYDISERKSIIETLQKSEQLAKQSLEELKFQKFALDKHAIVAVTDVQGRITYANSKFCEISGYSLEELIGRDHNILSSGHHPKGFFKDMYRTVAGGDVWHAEVCNRAKNGKLYWVDTTISPYIDGNCKPQSYISIRTDITQRVMAEEKSNRLALYDALTELPNRRLLQDRLNQALASSSRSGQLGALLFLDLDHFKTLNDTLGHAIGDVLLQQVAKRLISCVREGDTVARLGGDEFVLLLEDLGKSSLEAAINAETIGEKIRAALNLPYLLDTHEHRSTPSIGATLYDNHQFSMDVLLKQADIAMYAAKKSGRNALRFFDPKMQQAITSHADLEHELRIALELHQFQLHYQIQVDHTGAAFGAEALIRWNHPDRGIVSPFYFIPMAEETGLILPIGKWVIDTACAQLKIWQQDPVTSNLLLAVNVSTKQFLQTDFVNQVKAAVKRFGIDPTRLKLELTESLLADNLNEIRSAMTTLGEFGIKFSLDDFGTGYSSLQYLKTLPLSQLKIDQSFVRDIATDNSDKAIVLTIIIMAHKLSFDVIAEGVETEEQRQFLMDNGCLHYQGYLFSKPVPIEEFEALLRKI